MSTKAFGSITIVDIGDLGELSVTPESNQPTMVIYDPDSNSYNPNWNTNNLILSPVVYYGGKKLLDSTSTSIPAGTTVTWKQKIGTTETTLTTGSGGKLTVNNIPFNPDGTKLITYIVTVTYTEANLGTTLEAVGQITFGLIQNASKVKSVSITGESAFLYNSSGTAIKSSIVLTATTKNVNITGWFYKNSSGTFTEIKSSGASITSATITINESTSDYFNNDLALFKVQTNDADVYDEHSIIKIRDGANGTSLDAAVLSNEDQMIPCNSSGNPISGAFDNCTTTLTIYEGNTPTYSGWSINVDQTHGVTGTWDANTHTFSASAISAESGYVVFTCSKTGHNTLVKTFSLTKVKAGADGTSPVIYSLEASSLVSNKNINNVFTPSTITLNSYKQIGSGTKNSYSGRLKYFLNGSSTGTEMTGGDKSSWTYTISDASTKQIRFVLYAAGATTTELDSVTVAVTADGQTGAQGVGGLSFVLGNYTDVIPCTNGGLVTNATQITIPFTAFKGTSRVACTATYSTLPSGVTLSSNTPGTASASGQLVFSIAQNATLGGASILTGVITITITAEGATGTQTYTWTKNLKALDGQSGEDAIIFQIYSPNGNVISNDSNNVILDSLLVKGASEITSDITYHWYQYSGSSYSTDRGTSKQLTVTPSMINSYGSFKCVATYKSKTYEAYFSVYDKTDPLQIVVLSTLGDKIINSVGKGILYTNVYRNGEIVDKIKTTACGTTLPSSDNTDHYFWLLNGTEHSAILYQYNNGWKAVTTDPHTGTYTWSAYDINNITAAIPSAWGNGKALYIDANTVNKKTTFNVEVTI